MPDPSSLRTDRHRITRLTGLLGALAVLGVVGWAFADGANGAGDPALTVVTFGGRLRAAQIELLTPRLQRQGVAPVLWAESLGELAPVGAQARAGNPVWDVVSLPSANNVTACERGWLEPISDADLGGAHAESFEPGTRVECGVGSSIWAMAVGYRCDAGKAPGDVADFFDLKRFPGRRGLPRTPQGVLEWALLADGVPVERIYAALRTEAGVTRAFRKLETIRSQVIWWESGAQAAQLLIDREVVLTATPSARIALAAEGEKAPLCLQWKGHIRNVDVWGVLRGTKHRAAAMAFVREATDPTVQAGLALRYPNAPVRRASAELVAQSPPSATDYRRWLATTPENAAASITTDAEFWADRSDDLYLRFVEWLGRGA